MFLNWLKYSRVQAYSTFPWVFLSLRLLFVNYITLKWYNFLYKRKAVSTLRFCCKHCRLQEDSNYADKNYPKDIMYLWTELSCSHRLFSDHSSYSWFLILVIVHLCLTHLTPFSILFGQLSIAAGRLTKYSKDNEYWHNTHTLLKNTNVKNLHMQLLEKIMGKGR